MEIEIQEDSKKKIKESIRDIKKLRKCENQRNISSNNINEIKVYLEEEILIKMLKVDSIDIFEKVYLKYI